MDPEVLESAVEQELAKERRNLDAELQRRVSNQAVIFSKLSDVCQVSNSNFNTLSVGGEILCHNCFCHFCIIWGHKQRVHSQQSKGLGTSRQHCKEAVLHGYIPRCSQHMQQHHQLFNQFLSSIFVHYIIAYNFCPHKTFSI